MAPKKREREDENSRTSTDLVKQDHDHEMFLQAFESEYWRSRRKLFVVFLCRYFCYIFLISWAKDLV